MVKFRQTIRAGERGGDVKATKDGMVRMHVDGSGAMGKTDFAGPAWVRCIKHVQRHHGLPADGIYGPATHKIIAPHFTTRDNYLYRTAKLRHHKQPSAVNMSAQAAAKQLINYHNQGKFHDDSGRTMAQIYAASQGKAVWSQMGKWVYLDKLMLEALVELVSKGFHVGTFAMCSDHPYDGPHGHAGGKAVDISSVNGVAIMNHNARTETLGLAKHLRSGMPASLHPWQLICDGYGYMHDSEISACTIPGANFYGYTTMSQHRNHVHLGYYS